MAHMALLSPGNSATSIFSFSTASKMGVRPVWPCADLGLGFRVSGPTGCNTRTCAEYVDAMDVAHTR